MHIPPDERMQTKVNTLMTPEWPADLTVGSAGPLSGRTETGANMPKAKS